MSEAERAKRYRERQKIARDPAARVLEELRKEGLRAYRDKDSMCPAALDLALGFRLVKKF